MTIQIHTIHIRAVIVEWVHVGCIAEQFETVCRPVPVDGRSQVYPSPSILSRHSSVRLQRAFILVVPFRTVKGVRSEPPAAQTCIPVHGYQLVGVVSLVETFTAAVVGIQSSGLVPAVTVAAGVAT